MDDILKLFGGAENIWTAIQQNASRLGIEATRTMLELFYVLKSPDTGMMNKTLIVAALGYQLLPEDALPRDEYGWLGFLDNGAALALAYNRVKSSVTPEISQQVNNILLGWFGTIGQDTSSNNYTQQETIPTDSNPTFTPPTINIPTSQPNNNPIWNDDEDVVID